MARTAPEKPGFNERRLRSNLLRNDRAMSVLAMAGIDPALVEAIGLGMKEPYDRTDGSTVAGVLTYVLATREGRQRYGYINLPGVTLGPLHPVAWSPGDALTVQFGMAGVLLVVGSPLGVFQVRGSAERRMLGLSAVSTSKPEVIPAAWRDVGFWGRWDRVIMCDDVPATIAKQISEFARRPVEQAVGVLPHFSDHQPTQMCVDEWVDAVLEQAEPYAVRQLSIFEDEAQRPGDFAADPIQLHGGFARGYLYYPFVVERRQHSAAGGGRLLHSYETLVLRSDGAMLEAVTLPGPPGASARKRVHALTDGTRIATPPEISRNATWSLRSIQAFAAARSEGRDPCSRRPSELVTEVREYLASRVILPRADDHWLASIFVMMTHMFRVFESLPILLIRGPQGSGKTELAAAIASIGFNAAVMGQGSAPAVIRLSRECGGLVVLDDAEGLGGNGFSELAQCLKVGYRANTARKAITQASGKVEIFDFYGPRVVTCTRGVDPVLASRCITINTASADFCSELLDIEPNELRDELHTFAMVQSQAVREAYSIFLNEATGRADEIWAPLFALARAIDCSDTIHALNRIRSQCD